MDSRRTLLLALFLSFPALGADIPQGPMPQLDGTVGAEEWADSYKMAVPHGTARLRVAGRALCIAIEVQRPYGGQRIDLRTSDPTGDRYTLVQLHPACYLPRPPFTPLPPVMMMHATWAKRETARYEPPYSAKMRARLLQKGTTSWSAEFAIALESLDLPIGKPAVFNLTISDPFSESARPLATPPAQWEPLNAQWDAKADLFMTPNDDKVNAWAQGLFSEGLDRARNVDPTAPVLGDAFDERMDAGKIAEQLSMAALEVEIAPDQYHGLWFRFHLLRRANRLKEAEAAYRTLIERLPAAVRLEPVVQERNSALLAECRFDEFEQENRGMGTKAMDWVQEMRTAWDVEQSRRKRDAAQAATRLLLKTTRGDVEIELYRFDEEGYDEKLVEWLGAAKLADQAPKWATGALGIAWPGLPSGVRTPETGDAPRAWRGTVSLQGDGTLLLATGPAHITLRSCAIGRIVKGMEHVDAMTASDRIESAKVVPASARADGG